jgi:hypothetical protein
MRVGDARRWPATAGPARRCARWRWLPASGRRRRSPGGRAPTASRWCRGLSLWGVRPAGSRSAGRLTAGSCRGAGRRPSGPREPTGPVKYWPADLDQDPLLVDLVRPARLGWRVEHDARGLRDALGLDHFQGRSWPGWHHHLTLVLVAHALVALQRLDPKRLRRSDDLPGRARAATAARLWAGACPSAWADSHGRWHGYSPQPHRHNGVLLLLRSLNPV